MLFLRCFFGIVWLLSAFARAAAGIAQERVTSDYAGMSYPTRMRAAVITTPGGPEVLEVQSRAVPVPGPSEILVRVLASALNRADVHQRKGRYPAPPGVPPDIPGLEFAGEVVASGDQASAWSVGDRVFGLVGGGAHAEFLVTHERAVARIPSAMSWSDAGGTAEAFITAHDALVSQASMRPGETVLIHAVGSGVGLAATQLVGALGGRAFGTARDPLKLSAARDAGMTEGMVPAESGSIAAAVREWTMGRGVDVVLDLVGGAYVAEGVASLAPKGRLILIGTLAGRESTLDLGLMLGRRLTVRGTVLRSRPLEERIDVTQRFAREVVPWLEDGTLRTRTDATFPLAEIAEAHRLMESNASIGKIVLDMTR